MTFVKICPRAKFMIKMANRTPQQTCRRLRVIPNVISMLDDDVHRNARPDDHAEIPR